MSVLLSTEHPSFLSTYRRLVLAVIGLSAFVLALFGVRYAGESDGRWLDDKALAFVRETLPLPRRLARVLINIYDPRPLVVGIVLLVAVCLLLRRRRLAVLALVGPVATGVATQVLKDVIDRTKLGDLAFPSGHMGSATAVALVVGLLLVSLLGLRPAAAAAVVAGYTLLVAGLTSWAMTSTNYHYLTDTIGGFCTAVIVVLGLALLLERWPRPRQPALSGHSAREVETNEGRADE